jgi:hypothetical protein
VADGAAVVVAVAEVSTGCGVHVGLELGVRLGPAEVVEPALASYVPVGRTVATERGVDTGVGTGVGTGVATGGGTGVETGVGTGVGVGATTPHGIENRTEYSLLPSGA